MNGKCDSDECVDVELNMFKMQKLVELEGKFEFFNRIILERKAPMSGVTLGEGVSISSGSKFSESAGTREKPRIYRSDEIPDQIIVVKSVPLSLVQPFLKIDEYKSAVAVIGMENYGRKNPADKFDDSKHSGPGETNDKDDEYPDFGSDYSSRTAIMTKDDYSELAYQSLRSNCVNMGFEDVPKNKAKSSARAYMFGNKFETVEVIGSKATAGEVWFLDNHEIGHFAYYPKYGNFRRALEVFSQIKAVTCELCHEYAGSPETIKHLPSCKNVCTCGFFESHESNKTHYVRDKNETDPDKRTCRNKMNSISVKMSEKCNVSLAINILGDIVINYIQSENSELNDKFPDVFASVMLDFYQLKSKKNNDDTFKAETINYFNLLYRIMLDNANRHFGKNTKFCEEHDNAIQGEIKYNIAEKLRTFSMISQTLTGDTYVRASWSALGWVSEYLSMCKKEPPENGEDGEDGEPPENGDGPKPPKPPKPQKEPPEGKPPKEPPKDGDGGKKEDIENKIKDILKKFRAKAEEEMYSEDDITKGEEGIRNYFKGGN